MTVFDFLAEHQLYIVLTVVLIIWIGIISFLFRLEHRIGRLEGKAQK